MQRSGIQGIKLPLKLIGIKAWSNTEETTNQTAYISSPSL
jgi:hypothetical protein